MEGFVWSVVGVFRDIKRAFLLFKFVLFSGRRIDKFRKRCKM